MICIKQTTVIPLTHLLARTNRRLRGSGEMTTLVQISSFSPHGQLTSKHLTRFKSTPPLVSKDLPSPTRHKSSHKNRCNDLLNSTQILLRKIAQLSACPSDSASYNSAVHRQTWSTTHRLTNDCPKSAKLISRPDRAFARYNLFQLRRYLKKKRCAGCLSFIRASTQS